MRARPKGQVQPSRIAFDARPKNAPLYQHTLNRSNCETTGLLTAYGRLTEPCPIVWQARYAASEKGVTIATFSQPASDVSVKVVLNP
jgi:hypothetical protein